MCAYVRSSSNRNQQQVATDHKDKGPGPFSPSITHILTTFCKTSSALLILSTVSLSMHQLEKQVQHPLSVTQMASYCYLI